MIQREADCYDGKGGAGITAEDARKLSEEARFAKEEAHLARLPEILKSVKVAAIKGENQVTFFEILPKVLIEALKASPTNLRSLHTRGEASSMEKGPHQKQLLSGKKLII